LWYAKRYDDAAVALREAIARNPGDAWVHQYLGVLLMSLGDLQAAHDAFRKATDREPENPYFWCSFAEAAGQLGLIQKADECFKRS
jgi:predicted Zn-dependent protease